MPRKRQRLNLTIDPKIYDKFTQVLREDFGDIPVSRFLEKFMLATIEVSIFYKSLGSDFNARVDALHQEFPHMPRLLCFMKIANHRMLYLFKHIARAIGYDDIADGFDYYIASFQQDSTKNTDSTASGK